MVKLGTVSDVYNPLAQNNAMTPTFRDPKTLTFTSAEVQMNVRVVASMADLAALGGCYVCLASDPKVGYVIGGESMLEFLAAGHVGKRIHLSTSVDLSFDPRTFGVSYAGRRRLPNCAQRLEFAVSSSQNDVLVFGWPCRAVRAFGILGMKTSASHPLVLTDFLGQTIPLRVPAAAGAYTTAHPTGYSVVTSVQALLNRSAMSSVLDHVDEELRSNASISSFVDTARAKARRTVAEDCPVVVPILLSASTLGGYVGLGVPAYRLASVAAGNVAPGTAKFVVAAAPSGTTVTTRGWKRVETMVGRVGQADPLFVTFNPVGAPIPGPDGCQLILPDSVRSQFGFYNVSDAVATSIGLDTLAQGSEITVSSSAFGHSAALYGDVTTIHNGPLGNHPSPDWDFFPRYGGLPYVTQSSLPRHIGSVLEWAKAWPLANTCLTYKGSEASRVDYSGNVGNVDVQGAIMTSGYATFPVAVDDSAIAAGTDTALQGALADAAMSDATGAPDSWMVQPWSAWQHVNKYSNAMMSEIYALMKDA